MKKNNHSMKKSITILTILALLVLILPVAVMAKAGRFMPTLPSQASRNATEALAKNEIKPVVPDVKDIDDEDEDETDSDTETKDVDVDDDDMNSEQAAFVAGRNEWAKANGIPPGHANLFYKYLLATGTSTDFVFPVVPADLTGRVQAPVPAANTGAVAFTLEQLLAKYKSGEITVKDIQELIKAERKPLMPGQVNRNQENDKPAKSKTNNGSKNK